MPQGWMPQWMPQWSLPNGEPIRLLICCSGFGFIPFWTVIKGKQECCGFLRPTCLLFSHTFLFGAVPPFSVYGALLVLLPPPQPSNLLTAPLQPFGSNMMASSPLHVITIYVVS